MTHVNLLLDYHLDDYVVAGYTLLLVSQNQLIVSVQNIYKYNNIL